MTSRAARHRRLWLLVYVFALPATAGNQDVARTIEQGNRLALALYQYVIDHTAIPVELKSLDQRRFASKVPPVAPYVKEKSRDAWGTAWRVVPDRRRVQDITLDLDGVRYAYRGSTWFRLVSAGRDRTFGTPDDIAVDAFGRLWHFPEKVRLRDVFNTYMVQHQGEMRAAVVSDAIKDFVEDHGGCPYRFPATIAELLAEGYINDQLAQDTWGRPWVYCAGPADPVQRAPVGTMQFEVTSPGTDGVWHTADDVSGGEVLGFCQPPRRPQPGCEQIRPDVAEKMPHDEAVGKLIALLACEDPEVRRTAYDSAWRVTDSKLLGPMMKRYPYEPGENQARIVGALARLKDPVALPLILSVLGENPQAPDALRAIGSPARLAEAIDAYLKPWSWTPWSRLWVLETLVEWAPGNDFVLRLVEDAFDHADEKLRPRLATLALKAQLEPDKPPPPGARPVTREEDCITWEQWYRILAPYSKREVERLLRERNRKLLRVVGFGEREEVRGSFENLSRTLSPQERVALWRRVIEVFEGPQAGDPSTWSCSPYAARRQMLSALISMANARLPRSQAECEHLLDEALAVSVAVSRATWVPVQDPQVLAAISKVRDRAKRLQGLDDRRAPARLPHHFQAAGIVGMGAGDLFLERDGTFRFVTPTCVINIPCGREEQVVDGRYVIEKGYVVLNLRTSTSKLDVTDAYFPVVWGGAMYLVDDKERFCAAIEDARMHMAAAIEHGIARPEDFDRERCRALRSLGFLVEADGSERSEDECIPAAPDLCAEK